MNYDQRVYDIETMVDQGRTLYEFLFLSFLITDLYVPKGKKRFELSKVATDYIGR